MASGPRSVVVLLRLSVIVERPAAGAGWFGSLLTGFLAHLLTRLEAGLFPFQDQFSDEFNPFPCQSLRLVGERPMNGRTASTLLVLVG